MLHRTHVDSSFYNYLKWSSCIIVHLLLLLSAKSVANRLLMTSIGSYKWVFIVLQVANNCLVTVWIFLKIMLAYVLFMKKEKISAPSV